jgi:phage terminase small subunit
MPRGGHGRSGPPPADTKTRALHGSRTRPQHRTIAPPAGTLGCQPPPGLSRSEQRFWNYYAPELAAERRLTGKTRDALAKYCTALATVADLRRQIASRKPRDLENRSGYRKELRQWLLASRLYENDLLLNPASAARSLPRGEEPTDPLPPPAQDPFSEFDAEDARVQ